MHLCVLYPVCGYQGLLHILLNAEMTGGIGRPYKVPVDSLGQHSCLLSLCVFVKLKRVDTCILKSRVKMSTNFVSFPFPPPPPSSQGSVHNLPVCADGQRVLHALLLLQDSTNPGYRPPHVGRIDALLRVFHFRNHHGCLPGEWETVLAHTLGVQSV